MCGITGIMRFGAQVDETEIKSMTKSIAHRGPDGEGIFIKDNIALGHRRLSIIDIEGGKQPMSYNNGNLYITYNGEIYNYIELKKELKALGHKFKTNSDTEVILASYNEWHEKCLEKLRGMFAFCIADFKKKEIFLARDPIGIKPLVYWKNNDFFGFASELPALRKIKAPKPTGNISAIDDFLRLSYIPAPNTIYKDIYKLEPGTYMTVSFDGKYSEPVKYYNFEFYNNKNDNSDWVEKTDKYLKESVKSHLVSDVPFGVFLSGGIDSTLIAGAMSKILDTKIKAFTIGFNDPKYDELKFAEKAANKYGIELISKTINIDDTSIIEQLINNHGEPFGDSSIIPTWHVCKLARSHVPMVLSGDGGDELFGGYLSHSNWMKNSPYNYIKNQFGKKNYYLGFRGLAGYTKKIIINKSTNFLDEWYSKFSYSNENFRRELWKSNYQNNIENNIIIFEKTHQRAKKMSRLDYAQYMDIHTNLPGHILSKVDTASMSHGLEVRPPIIDKNILELASIIPKDFKYDHKNKISLGKSNLKKLLGRDFENDFIFREKKGFSIPKYKWFYKNNFGHEILLNFLSSNENKLNLFFDKNKISKLLDDHSNKTNDNSNFLWLILILGIWFNQNKDINFN